MGDIDFVANLTDDELKEIIEKLYRKKSIIDKNLNSPEVLTDQPLRNLTLEQQLEIIENIAHRLFTKIINYANGDLPVERALADFNIGLYKSPEWHGKRGDLFFRWE